MVLSVRASMLLCVTFIVCGVFKTTPCQSVRIFFRLCESYCQVNAEHAQC